MRIVIDMQGAQSGSRLRGIGRYTNAFVQSVAKNRGSHTVIVALNGLFPETIEPIRALLDGILPQENIRIWYAPGPVSDRIAGTHNRREAAELIREAFLAALRPDVIHITSLFEGFGDDAVTSIGRLDLRTPVTATLYDLIPLLNPDQYLKPDPAYEEHYKRKISYLKKASHLLSISNFSRLECIEHLEIPEEFITNVSTAIDPGFLDSGNKVPFNSVLDRFGINRPFVLYTGASDERKNLPRLVSAYASLPEPLRATHQLVLAGSIPDETLLTLQALGHSKGLRKNDVIFTRHVTDNELVCLYRSCELYVFPSWHEGFGLPALEAMACGAPVIAAKTTSLPEVVGCEEALFDPFDSSSIASKIEKALLDSNFLESLRIHGLNQAKLFSWDETAQRAIKTWELMAKPAAPDSASLSDTSLYAHLAPYLATQTEEVLYRTAVCLARNVTSRQYRQLFVDVSELVKRDAKSGIQRVVRSILKTLLETPPAGYRIEPVYSSESDGFFYARKFMSEFNPTDFESTSDTAIDFNSGDIFLGLDLNHDGVADCFRHLEMMRNHGVKVHFLVYDLLPLRYPQFWDLDGSIKSIHSAWLTSISHFDGAACISKSVADELSDWLTNNSPSRFRPFKVDWFHLGADIANSRPSTGVPEDAGSIISTIKARPAFLMVGTLEPRKGHIQVLEAFDLIWKAGAAVNLVIVGKQGWLVDSLISRLNSHVLRDSQLFWVQNASDEYLDMLYSASTCLIAASYGEGFGLPLIEAAQKGLPIIARDIPVFREVAGESAFYFKADKPEQVALSIHSWLSLYNNDLHPKSNTLQWLSWRESTDQLLKALDISNNQS